MSEEKSTPWVMEGRPQLAEIPTKSGFGLMVEPYLNSYLLFDQVKAELSQWCPEDREKIVQYIAQR